MLEEYGFFNGLTQEEIINFANGIVKTGVFHDCNGGEIFNEIGKRIKFCYCCKKGFEEFDGGGLCKECV